MCGKTARDMHLSVRDIRIAASDMFAMQTRYAPLEVRDMSQGRDMFAMQTRYALRARYIRGEATPSLVPSA